MWRGVNDTVDRLMKPDSQQNLELARHKVKVPKPERTQGSRERISRCLSLSSVPSSSVGQSRETGGRGQSRTKPGQPRSGRQGAGLRGRICPHPKLPSWERTAICLRLRPRKECETLVLGESALSAWP